MKLYLLVAAIGVAVAVGLCISCLYGERTDGKTGEDPEKVADKLLSYQSEHVLGMPSVGTAPLLKLLDEDPAAYAPALASHLAVPSGKALSEKERHDTGISAGLLARGGTKHGVDALRKYALDLFKIMTDVKQDKAAAEQAHEMFYGVLRMLAELRDASLAEQVVSIFADEPLWDRYKIHYYLTMTARGDAKVIAVLKKLYEDEKTPLHKDEMLGQLIEVLSRTNDFSWFPTALLSKSDKESKQAYLDFSSGFSEAVDGLIAIVSNEGFRETNPLAVRRAIFALGKFRAENAIPALVRLMDWTPMKGEKDAVSALVRIGKPAANAMLELLASNPPANIDNPILVLGAVEGDDVALFRLTKARDAEKDEQRKKNLTAAIDFLTQQIRDKQTPAASGEQPAAAGGTAPASSSAGKSSSAPHSVWSMTPPKRNPEDGLIGRQVVDNQITARDSASTPTTSRPSGTPNATGTGTSSEGGAEDAVAEATPFPWAIVIVVAIAALALGAITTLLLARRRKA